MKKAFFFKKKSILIDINLSLSISDISEEELVNKVDNNLSISLFSDDVVMIDELEEKKKHQY